MANEETIFGTNVAGKVASKTAGAAARMWKPVTIGSSSGILMGGGAILAGNHINAANTAADQSAGHDAPVASVSDDMSFAQAFAAARAEVGPGGVFQWHGAVYNTYTAEEWQAMSEAEHQAFAQQVHTEVPADHVDSQHSAYTPHHTAQHHEHHEHHQHQEHHEPAHHDDPSAHNTAQTVHEPGQGFEIEGVRIVGYGEVDGHLVVGYDVDGDNDPDIAIIDVDDSGDISGVDVVMDSEGNKATIAELQQAIEDPQDINDADNSVYASNPDVADDGMPDYMNDGMSQA